MNITFQDIEYFSPENLEKQFNNEYIQHLLKK